MLQLWAEAGDAAKADAKAEAENKAAFGKRCFM
jgi:hypothetical protein